MSAIRLYFTPQVISVTMTDRGIRNRNLPFNDSDFKVFKGAHNPIEFAVRDNDRKPISLVGRSVEIVVQEFYQDTFVLQKDAEVIDAVKGKIRVTFTPTDLANLDPSFYTYSMLLNQPEGISQLLFVDQDNNVNGYFELFDGALPGLAESVKILTDDFTSTNTGPGGLGPTVFFTGAFPSDATVCENDGLHTVSVQGEDYAGKFFVQGSLEESPTSNENDWFDINLTPWTPYIELGNKPSPDCVFTGIEAFNFTGSIRWVRFKHIPDIDNTGQILKILYRN